MGIGYWGLGVRRPCVAWRFPGGGFGAAVSLALLVLAGAGPARGEPVRGRERLYPGSTDTWLSADAYPFACAQVDCSYLRKEGADSRTFWRAGSTIGRFTTGFLAMNVRGGGAYGEPEANWMAPAAGGGLRAEVDFPVLRQGLNVGQVLLRMAESPEHPNWIFFRLRGSDAAPLESFSIAARIRPWSPVMGGTPSRLYLNWPDGRCASGEMPPWANGKPDFNALAFSSRGQGEESLTDLMVFDPADVATVRFQRWDGVVIMVFSLQPVSECVLALGYRTEGASETAVIPEFMQRGRQVIFEAMKQIDWEPSKPDRTALDRLLAEGAKLLEEYPDLDRQKEFDRLSGLAAGLPATDWSALTKLERSARVFLDELATWALSEQTATP